jgi:hypothetical protein
LRELLAKLPTPEKLLACTPTQLDGILTAAISERIKRSQQDQTARRNIELTALQGMYPIGEGVTFAQRQRVDILQAGMRTWRASPPTGESWSS